MATVDLTKVQAAGTLRERRYAMYRFNASKALFTIPPWFVNNRDTLYVTGCGAGGSAGAANATYYGTGGGGGAASIRAPLKLWGDIRNLSIAIGANGGPAAAGASGPAGSNTVLSDADSLAVLMVLGGGGGGGTNTDGGESFGIGGLPTYAGMNSPMCQINSNVTDTSNPTILAMTEFLTAAATSGPWGLLHGRHAFDNNLNPTTLVYNTNAGGGTVCAAGPFGGGTQGVGYGYGAVRHPTLGAGQAGTSVGGNGFLILEFEEGA